MWLRKLFLWLFVLCPVPVFCNTDTVQLWHFEVAEASGRQTVPAGIPKHATYAGRLTLNPQLVKTLNRHSNISLSVPMYSQPLVLPIKQVARHEQQHILRAGDAAMRVIMTTDGENSFATVITERGVWSIRGKGDSGVIYQTHDPFHQHNQIEKDYLIPPVESAAKLKQQQATTQRQENLNSDAVAIVDTYIIYNQAVEAMYGPAGAITRINHLIAVTNDIFENSNVNMRVNALRIDRVEYSQASNSEVALRHATGVAGYTGVLTDARQMRDAIGADAMIFYRPLVNDGTCGIAWLNSSFNSNFWMVSHTSIDCGEEVTAHELGHNMGLSHSRRQGDTGATFPFALGYGVNNNFSTVMAYPWSFGSADRVFKFSSPELNCNGLPCGVDRTDPVHGADAVYALNQKRFEIAQISQRTSGSGSLQVQSIGADNVSIQSSTGQQGLTTYTVSNIPLGEVVSLTAPATADNIAFLLWLGCDRVIDFTCEVTIRGDVSLRVVYSDGALEYGTILGAPELDFSSSGAAVWEPDFTRVFNGVASLRSGTVLNNQTSVLSTKLEGPGILRFSWQVSSEEGYDFLSFYINNELISEISGSKPWQMLEYELADATHQIEWRYSKDFSISAGEDAGWLGSVNWQPIVPDVTVTINKTGNGKGAIRISSLLFECGENCESESFTIAENSPLVFLAEAAIGSEFIGWANACSGSESCALAPNTDITVTAEFALQRILIDMVSVDGGSVQKSSDINYFGELITFTLNPEPGFRVVREVAGTCPTRVWLNALQYRIGPLTTACSITFNFVENKRRKLPIWLFLKSKNAL